MGKRGPRSRATEEIIKKVQEMYEGGAAHRAIAAEVGISETNIRRIMKVNGMAKRNRKLCTLLSANEEEALVKFLHGLGPGFRGKYRQLREYMERYATENNMKCTFTYSWRDGFCRRHRDRLLPNIIKLLSPKVQRDDDVDSDVDLLATPHVLAGTSLDPNYNPAREAALLDDSDPGKEPSVWRQKPKLSLAERSIRESRKAFAKAGLSKEETDELLLKLKVPGVAELTAQPGHSALEPDVVAAAVGAVFGETTVEPPASSAVKRARKTPQKKSPLQVEVLEKAFQKSQTCGDKRAKKLGRALGLAPAQIIYWFHNTARHRRKLTNNSITISEPASAES